MIQDPFYTPNVLANRLVSYINKASVKTVVDFCVGDGELLRAAIQKWPNIKCFGSDISEEAIYKTRKEHIDWHLCQMDFLDINLRLNSSIIVDQPLYELVLLNPPFSCIGGTIHEVEFDGQIFQVSTGMKFLVTALKYLEKDGILYGIFPSSIAYSQKDRNLWKVLENKHNLSILEEPKIQYFKRCAPNVILVSANDFSKVSKNKTITRISLNFNDLSVFRGKVSMNQLNNRGGNYFLVHSTNLRRNKIVNLSIKIDKQLSKISGPAILLPRVGKPSYLKVCVITEEESYILSDCIIAVKTVSQKEASILYHYIIDNWKIVEEMYTGTGAKYITIEKISQFLNLDIIELDYQKNKALVNY